MRSARRSIGVALVAAATSAGVLAQQGEPGGTSVGRFLQGLWGDRGTGRVEPEAAEIPHDGRFVIARIRFTVGGGGFGDGFGRRRGGREPAWAHDHPRAERNFMKMLGRITTIRTYEGTEGGAIVDIGSKELFRYPIAYFCEPGFWTQTDEEAANLRAYLQKGGFIIFDDFRGRDLDNFTAEMRRVLPDARLIELDAPHQVFHSFFEIDSLDFRQFYDRERPVFYGIFVDNDPSKRMLAVVNYNNDISEYWEWSDTGWNPIDLTNEAYKFGVNYVVYGMTH